MKPTGCKLYPVTSVRRICSSNSLLRQLQEVEIAPRFCDHIPWIHDQPLFPSCCGESMMAMFEVALPSHPRLSGVRAWTDARRREGCLSKLEEGTYPHLVVESAQWMGPCPYVHGEETSREMATHIELPHEGVQAFDLRQKNVSQTHITVNPSDIDVHEIIRRAMMLGWQFQLCTGTTDLYQRRGPEEANDPAGLDELSGSYGGHAQRIAGWIDQEGDKFCYLVQNSWGEDWGGTYAVLNVDDSRMTWLPGCCLVEPVVLQKAWEINGLLIGRINTGLPPLDISSAVPYRRW